MTILSHIDSDCKSLHNYFEKLFELLHQARKEDQEAPIEVLDIATTESLSSHHGISHLIKPDMVKNIYSLIDFWMQKICNLHQKRKGLCLSYRDIKGNGDFHIYHKYLTQYAEVNLDEVQNSYLRLDELRKVRNRLIHNGGYIPSGEEEKYSNIDGITIQHETLIIIEDNFIWDMLHHAQIYMSAASHA